MKSAICLVALIAFVMWPVAVKGDSKTLHTANYHRWQQMDTRELARLADKYFRNSERKDSALLCYTIIANRYYNTNKKDTAQLRIVAAAMNRLGVLYQNHYYDYQKSYANLLMAQEIAEEHQFENLLTAIYINLGNIYQLKNSMKGTMKVDSATFKQYQKAYYSAVKLGCWEEIMIATYNYASLADDEEVAKAITPDLRSFMKLNIPDSVSNRDFVRTFCQGMLASVDGNDEKALQHYQKAYQLVDDAAENGHTFQMSVLNTECRLLAKMGRHDDARRLLLSMVEREKDNHFNLYVLYLALHEYFDFVNNPAQSKEYELLYLREKDYVMEQSHMLDAQQTEFLLQIDKMNEEMKRLNYERRQQRIVTAFIAIFALLMLIIAILLYYRWRQTQATNRRLYQRTQDLLAAEQRALQLEQESKDKEKEMPAADSETQKEHPAEIESENAQADSEVDSDLLHRILYVLETSQEIFSNDFSLLRLTELVGERSSNYVSRAINRRYNRTFAALLNDFRIREACRRMSDVDVYGQLTNEAIAQSVGFLSYPNFVANFKKFTGLTPSAYQKQAKEAANAH